MEARSDRKKSVWIIVGTRPEVIKQAPVIQSLRTYKNLKTFIVSTGQHRKTISDRLKEFDLEIDIEINLQKTSNLNDLAGEIFNSASEILIKFKPDVIVVQGDTTSAAMVALAAFYLRIPVIHLEAGLRTGDINSPFPEEANRKIISQVCSLHLCPTINAAANLIKEGFDKDTVILSGNTVVDSLNYFINSKKIIFDRKLNEFISDGNIVLVTSHRRESWEAGGIERIGLGISASAKENPDIKYVVLLHPNPIPSKMLELHLVGIRNVLLLGHQPYSVTCGLLNRAKIIITDSGGIQEEALSLGKPILVTREKTERIEGIEIGLAQIVGTDPIKIKLAVQKILKSPQIVTSDRILDHYGDGKAGVRSAEAITQFLA